jgi:glycosyltransferase involved in cell wall biosynthesis
LLLDRVRTLCEAGFHVSLVSSPGEQLERIGRETGADIRAIPMGRGISPMLDCLALFRLWRLIRLLKPDLVEFSTPKAGFLGSIAAWLCAVPARIHLLRGLKLETTKGLKRALLLGTERISALCAHTVICNSRSLRARMLENRLAPEAKLMVLGEGSSNGVDMQRFRPAASQIRHHLGIPLDVPVIGFSGRLTRDKGVPELIESFDLLTRHMPNARLLLVGWFDAAEDALDRAMRKRIRRHPQIIQTGFVQDTSPFYRTMDVLVLPSWREGFPNVVLEAAASGVPVVATSCTGSCDAVIPGITGLLVDPGDPGAICEAILSLLRDEERRRAMADAGRAWVAANYESRQVLGRMVAFYTNLVRAAAGLTGTEPKLIGERSTDLSVLP